MRKIYSLAFRSFVLTAMIATAHGSFAQTCTNAANAGACTGGNVTENFNAGNGNFTFTPNDFTYNSGAGNFQRAALRNNLYTITSGNYALNTTGGVIGVSLAGTTSVLDDVTIRVISSSTGAVLFTCTQTPANFISANQICVTYSGLTAGTAVRYQFVFNTANGASGDGTIVFDNFSNGGSAALLPVKLDNFEAANDGSGIKLNWSSSEEKGVARYEVERSADGVNFRAIGSVTADNRRNYSFVDVQPTSANNFYRLRMIDVDGVSRISHIVSVKSKVGKGIETYPNPVRDRMVVQHPKAVTGTVLQVVNLTGQVVRSTQVPVNAVVTPLELTGLSNGTYYIVYRSGSESFSQRITKQ